VQTITLHHTRHIEGRVRFLPASKSISNRVLVINALAGGGSAIANLSEANDTRLMIRLLESHDPEWNAEDAGTTMRFLTAYSAVQPGVRRLTGTHRMKQRPIGILVDALRQLGAEIKFLEKEGFPPLEVRGIAQQLTNQVAVRGDVSSQFISALMMIGPVLPEGLTIELVGQVGSRPYIEMTAALMHRFGAEVAWQHNCLIIPRGAYRPTSYTVENDWSAASYWFSFAALANTGEIVLPSMTLRSIQGDRIIADAMESLGVMCQPRGNDLLLMQKDCRESIVFDFTDCPDLAQTIMVVCAARNVTGIFTGLESLRIKETDRIAALQNELKKLGASLTQDDGRWLLKPAEHLPENIPPIATYDDHRMAMAFAPLAAMRTIQIENPQVVKKSYPRFWDDLRQIGIRITGL
jgi:3-phosphoshikimate 1-carboxyvinyltransferase